MSYPGKGKADYLELGDYNAQCYECGRKFKASMLKKHWQGYFVCPAHWEPRQPQDYARAVPDNQTPPWSQPIPGYTFVFNSLLCTEDSDTADLDPMYYISTETLYPLSTES
jgi:hypothetical protein